jgi:arylsulfatase A-like enzyme
VDALYDGAIASADAWLPKIQALINSKLREPQNTYWFVSSDHGTGLNHAKGMVGKTVYDDHVHVPLMIAGPDIQTQTVSYPTDTALDTSATVLDLAGIAPPDVYDGITLIPLLDGDFRPRGPRPITVSTLSGQFGVVYGDWKLVWSRGVNSLFDRRTDPLELTSVAAQHPELTQSLHAFARATLGRQQAAATAELVR